MIDLLLVRSNDQKNVYGAVNDFTACEPPFWAVQIAAFARQRGLKVDILDAEAQNLSPQEATEQIQKKNPRLVGMLVTGSNLSASTWKMHGAGILAKSLKDNSTVKIFMWGLHPSALPEQTMAEEAVDFVIHGENFQSICQLAEELKNADNHYESIPGLYYRTEDGIIQGNRNIVLQENLDKLPFPAWDLLPMDKYHAHNWQRMGEKKCGVNGYAVIATSLGCPFACSFCAVSALFDQKRVRYRSAESVVNEIGYLVEKHEVHYIKIIDECFVLNKKHVNEICDRLIERGYDLDIWAYARIDTVDEAILSKLAKANFKWLCYGIESASDKSLENVLKGQYNAEKVKKVIELTHQAGIHVIANYMFGLPEDDKDSMEQTLKLAKDLNCEWINMCSTMAYPGSKLYFDCVENNVPLPESWLGYSQYSYECLPLPTKHLSGKEVLAFRDHAFQDYFEDNDRYFNMIEKEFGQEAVQDIKFMLKKSLRRKIFE